MLVTDSDGPRATTSSIDPRRDRPVLSPLRPVSTAWMWTSLAIERVLFDSNRWTGTAQYHDPARYLKVDRDELFARCAEISAVWPDWLRPPSVAPPEGATWARGSAGRDAREVLSFKSPIPAGSEPNDTVRVHRFRARGEPAGAVLFHHPAFRKDLAWIVWFIEPLRERYDVFAMEAPWHMSRTPSGSFSGEWMINPNPLDLFEGMRQWIAENRALVALLERAAERGDAGARPVAMVGYSLGAYLSTLSTLFDARFPVVSVCSTNDYAYGVFEGILAKSMRSCLARAGITRAHWETLTRAIKLHPIASRFPSDRFFLISGTHDRVEPFESIVRLHEALRPRRRLLLPAGHAMTGVIFRRRIMREAIAFIAEEERDRAASAASGTERLA